jgi:PAS domain S-box-containing protein
MVCLDMTRGPVSHILPFWNSAIGFVTKTVSLFVNHPRLKLQLVAQWRREDGLPNMRQVIRIAARTRAWPFWARLSGAVPLLLAAVGARFALVGAEPGYPYVTFYIAVLLAAVLFGRWVGVLSIAAAIVLATWFFVPPDGGTLAEDPRPAGAALAFAVTGLAFVFLTTTARRSISERDETNAALRASEARLRMVLQGIGEPFYTVDADWQVLHASRAALEIWGRREDEVVGRRLLDALPEAAGSAPHAALEEAMRTRIPTRLEAISGVIGRWVEVDIYPTADGGLSVAFRDVHERRLAEERQRLLVAELTHRIKNTLALVLAIAEQTRRTVASPDAFHTVFRDRLSALARAHDALRRDGGTETSLAVVAREAIAPYRGGEAVPRVEILGPEVRLSSATAVALGMAFHELGTNAAKHGALSVTGGMVRLSWGNAEEDAAGARWHEVLWEEAGGPSIAGPPSRRGFGTRLLERGLAAQIGGAVTLDFAPSGLRCRIRVPASDSQGVVQCTRPPPRTDAETGLTSAPTV